MYQRVIIMSEDNIFSGSNNLRVHYKGGRPYDKNRAKYTGGDIPIH